MDSAHSDSQYVINDFISLFSSESRTEANVAVDSISSINDDLSIKWEDSSPIRNKKNSNSKVNGKRHALKTNKQQTNNILEILSNSIETNPVLPVNSQKSYSVYEDVLILNCRKSNKINPDREKFKNLSKLAVSLNRSGLGIQNRSRFLMRFSATDKLKMIKFAEESPAHAQRCSITWDIEHGLKAKGNSKATCNLTGFVRFKPDQTKKRLYKERKKNSKAFMDEFSYDLVEEKEENETTHFVDEQMIIDAGEQHNQSITPQQIEEEFDNMSCLSLIFNRSDPEVLRENLMLLHYIQEERQLAGSGRRFSN